MAMNVTGNVSSVSPESRRTDGGDLHFLPKKGIPSGAV
jgi:hypothetical protein